MAETPISTSAPDPDAGAQPRPDVLSLKRGRRSNAQIISDYEKAKQTQTPIITLQGKHLTGIVDLGFKFVAVAAKEPLWNTAPDESELIGEPLAEVLNDILPEIAKKYPKVLILAIAIISIGSKKAMDISRAKQIRKEPDHAGRVIIAEVPKAAGGITVFEQKLKERGGGVI